MQKGTVIKMIYREFQGKQLSALGLGAMRLPTIDGNDANINGEAAREMVDYAMKKGVNYYDTAWGYHSGRSEIEIGKALSAYPRESYYLATKFPGYDLSNMPKAAEIFEEQLKKCGVDYFDFYLFHNVCEMNIDAYLDPKYKINEYLRAQRESGRIRHLGFSAHGSCAVMRRFLEAYGDHMEFCQIQLNYLDFSFQDAKAKMELLAEYDIPVFVMEPLRGGRLAKLSEAEAAPLHTLRPEETAVGWAFRFIETLPNVVVTLSGMSNMTQLKENIAIFEEEKPLSAAEMATLLSVADGMLHGTLPCTACRYCVSHCPKGLNIPELLDLYNEHNFTGGGFIAPMALMAVPEEKHPTACVGCRSCEKVCPQQIKISEAMKDFSAKLGH